MSGFINGKEVVHLLDTIKRQYGYDFRGYAPDFLRRRLCQYIQQSHIESVGALQRLIEKNRQAWPELLANLSVPVTEPFRDPLFFQCLREAVVPWLATFPFAKIWHAGCATGEEAWSMAMLLEQCGLLERCQIYATDFNSDALQVAQRAVYSAHTLSHWQHNFCASGLPGNVLDHGYEQNRMFTINHRLRQRVSFAQHNLVTDHPFGQMHLILCRNVLIYFSPPLQNRVLKLHCDSLYPGGMLCIGPQESIRFSPVAEHFTTLNQRWNIHRWAVLPKSQRG